MAVQSAAGAKLYIGPANSSAANQAAYEALSYVLVGEIENIGDFGDTWTEIMFTSISDRRARKRKGTRNSGTLELTLGFDGADGGQAALAAALESDNEYAVRISLQDATTGSPANPTTFYVRALIGSRTVAIGDAESIVRSSISLMLNSAIIEVAAVSD
jgi:hypothetical protein